MKGFEGNERFQVLARLGDGGMGVVFRALDRETGEEVALKTLHALSGTALLHLKNEFRGLAGIHHRNLVALGELVEDQGDWFITMELVDGVDFLSWVRPGGTVDEGRLRAALGELALGLEALHTAGKVHRDVKPSNVLVARDGRVVLLDFGLVADSGREEDSIAGTAPYMAPEQAAAQGVSGRSDWYAVGVMLFEALAGRLPFEGSDRDILLAKSVREPPAPSALAKGPVPPIPEDLDELCAALLQYEPAARPEAAAVLRCAGLAAGEEAAPAFRPFVGREAELAALREAFARARTGGAELVLIEGESGVGKSALAHRFAESLADARRVMVLGGRCYERESVPYRGVDGVLDSLCEHLERSLPLADEVLPPGAALLGEVFPVLRRLPSLEAVRPVDVAGRDAVELRRRLFAALRELLTRLAERRAVLIVIDDLQWAGADSLALLGELVRAPGAPRLLLVATARPGLALDVPARRLPLTTLAPADARQLASRLLYLAGGTGDAGAIAEQAAGHPLFVAELARECVRHALRGDLAGGPIVKLDQALWRRVQGSAPAERDVVELVAVARAPIAQEVVAAAAGVPLGVFGRLAAALRSACLCRSAGPRKDDVIEPYHDRVAESVVAQLAPEALRDRHARLASALERRGDAPPEQLAAHLEGAGEGVRAAAQLEVGAERASRALAFERAAHLLRRALDAGGATGEARRRLVTRVADALAQAGRSAEAGRTYLDAAEGASGEERIRLRRRAAEELLRSGHVDEGLAALAEVLAAVGYAMARTPRRALVSLALRRAQVRLRGLRFRPRPAADIPPEERERIDLTWSVAVGLAFVDPIRGADFQARNLLLSLAAGDAYRVARALALEAGFSSTGGSRTARRTAALLTRAREVAEGTGDAHAVGLALGATGISRYLEGHWADGRRYCDEATAVFREKCAGASWERHSAELYACLSLSYLGELGELGRRVPERLREARERGDLYAETTLRHALSNMAWLGPDNPQGAREAAADAMRRWSREGFHLQHYWDVLAQGQIDLYVGDGEGAARRVREAWAPLKRSLLLQIQIIRVEAWYLRARAAVAVGDLATAVRDARRARRESGWAVPIADLIDALVARARGEDPAALLERAAGGFDLAGMGLHAAAARWRVGQAGPAGDWMRGHGVANPARMAAMLAPEGRA